FLRQFLFLHKGWEFECSDLSYHARHLTFTDLVLVDPQAFCLHAKQAQLDPFSKTIDLTECHCCLLGKLPSQTENSGWSISIREGVMEGPQLKAAHFSLTSASTSLSGRLEWGPEESLHWVWHDSRTWSVTADNVSSSHLPLPCEGTFSGTASCV